MLHTRAMDIARDAHAGQKSHAGLDFFKYHVCRVAGSLMDDPRTTVDALVVGYLHDVLNNTDVTIEHLVDQNLTGRQCLAMVSLWRFKGECDEWYLDRVCLNPIACLVKLHELKILIEKGPPAQRDFYRAAHIRIFDALEADDTL